MFWHYLKVKKEPCLQMQGSYVRLFNGEVIRRSFILGLSSLSIPYP